MWISNRVGDRDAFYFLFSPFVALYRIVIPDKYTDGNNITHMNVEMLCVHMCHSKGIADTFRMSIVDVCAGIYVSTLHQIHMVVHLKWLAWFHCYRLKLARFTYRITISFVRRLYTAVKWVLTTLAPTLIVIQTQTTVRHCHFPCNFHTHCHCLETMTELGGIIIGKMSFFSPLVMMPKIFLSANVVNGFFRSVLWQIFLMNANSIVTAVATEFRNNAN